MRSAFSFLEGSSLPEDLVQRAAELGHGTLALSDVDGLYGIPRFHSAAKKHGLRAIVGARVTLQANQQAPQSGARSEAKPSGGGWPAAARRPGPARLAARPRRVDA